eukprot:IDg18227t1
MAAEPVALSRSVTLSPYCTSCLLRNGVFRPFGIEAIHSLLYHDGKQASNVGNGATNKCVNGGMSSAFIGGNWWELVGIPWHSHQ